MNWTAYSWRRSGADNILAESGTIYEKQLPRTFASIRIIMLGFLEREQTARVANKRGHCRVNIEKDTYFEIFGLSLCDNHIDFPIYWTTHLIDFLSMFLQRQLLLLYSTIATDPRWITYGRFVFNIRNFSAFALTSPNLRVFDRSNCAMRVYSQSSYHFNFGI